MALCVSAEVSGVCCILRVLCHIDLLVIRPCRESGAEDFEASCFVHNRTHVHNSPANP